MDKKEMAELNDKIIRAIKTVYDPEIPVDVYELGLIYEIDIKDNKDVHVLMTLTSPSCPAAESIPSDVKNRIEMIKEINENFNKSIKTIGYKNKFKSIYPIKVNQQSQL